MPSCPRQSRLSVAVSSFGRCLLLQQCFPSLASIVEPQSPVAVGGRGVLPVRAGVPAGAPKAARPGEEGQQRVKLKRRERF